VARPEPEVAAELTALGLADVPAGVVMALVRGLLAGEALVAAALTHHGDERGEQSIGGRVRVRVTLLALTALHVHLARELQEHDSGVLGLIGGWRSYGHASHLPLGELVVVRVHDPDQAWEVPPAGAHPPVTVTLESRRGETLEFSYPSDDPQRARYEHIVGECHRHAAQHTR
jgi:hypothetical protein